jgi:hypothetical protein
MHGNLLLTFFIEYVDRVDSDFDESESSAKEEEIQEEKRVRAKSVYQDPRKKSLVVTDTAPDGLGTGCQIFTLLLLSIVDTNNPI